MEDLQTAWKLQIDGKVRKLAVAVQAKIDWRSAALSGIMVQELLKFVLMMECGSLFFSFSCFFRDKRSDIKTNTKRKQQGQTHKSEKLKVDPKIRRAGIGHGEI